MIGGGGDGKAARTIPIAQATREPGGSLVGGPPRGTSGTTQVMVTAELDVKL